MNEILRIAHTEHRCVMCQLPIARGTVYRALSSREKAHKGCEWPWDAGRHEVVEIRTDTLMGSARLRIEPKP